MAVPGQVSFFAGRSRPGSVTRGWRGNNQRFPDDLRIHGNRPPFHLWLLEILSAAGILAFPAVDARCQRRRKILPLGRSKSRPVWWAGSGGTTWCRCRERRASRRSTRSCSTTAGGGSAIASPVCHLFPARRSSPPRVAFVGRRRRALARDREPARHRQAACGLSFRWARSPARQARPWARPPARYCRALLIAAHLSTKINRMFRSRDTGLAD